MRLLGYTLLILGLAWFCILSIGVVSAVRPVTEQHMKEIPPEKQSFTRDDVYHDIRHALFNFATGLPPRFFVGALLMLGGGIILDITGRRKRGSQ